jgi:type I restriction enzyme S subunit
MSSIAAESPRAFVIWWHEMDRWVVPSTALLSRRLPAGWARVRIGDAVKQVSNAVKVKLDAEYKMAGVKWYGEGVFHRETVRGDGISARYLSPLVPGALIYNRLFAWKASFAVVPAGLADCFVSNEFPQFAPDATKLLPEYLYLWCVSASTIKAVNAASTGSAAVSRNRFREGFFVNFDIPLPPLPVQRKIVAAWEAARKFAVDTAAKIERLEREIEASFLADLGLKGVQRSILPKAFILAWSGLERWSVTFNQLKSVAIDIRSGKFPVGNLGNIAAVSYGIQKCPANRPGQHPRPYLRVANVQRDELDLRQIKYIDVPDKEFASLRLERGDLVVCEGNSADLVGRPAMWRGEIPDCVHQNHILKVRVDRSKAMPEFLLEYMSSVPARNHFRARAKFTTNLASINSNDLRELSVPLPSLPEQRVLVDRVGAGRAKIANLKAEAKSGADAAKDEVEAMILGTKPVE